jgi:hypothetical protein
LRIEIFRDAWFRVGTSEEISDRTPVSLKIYLDHQKPSKTDWFSKKINTWFRAGQPEKNFVKFFGDKKHVSVNRRKSFILKNSFSREKLQKCPQRSEKMVKTTNFLTYLTGRKPVETDRSEF